MTGAVKSRQRPCASSAGSAVPIRPSMRVPSGRAPGSAGHAIRRSASRRSGLRSSQFNWFVTEREEALGPSRYPARGVTEASDEVIEASLVTVR